jgi:hypothetical protein
LLELGHFLIWVTLCVTQDDIYTFGVSGNQHSTTAQDGQAWRRVALNFEKGVQIPVKHGATFTLLTLYGNALPRHDVTAVMHWLKACVHLSVLHCVWLRVGGKIFVIFRRAASEQWAELKTLKWTLAFVMSRRDQLEFVKDIFFRF